jgi:hypothetical protein
MSQDPSAKRPPTPPGGTERMGYHYPMVPTPPLWYVPPAAPKEKTAWDKLREWVPAIVVVATVAGWGIKAWRDFEQLKKDSEEQKAQIAQVAVDAKSGNERSGQALNVALDLAKQQRAMNDELKRINITRRNRPRPQDP